MNDADTRAMIAETIRHHDRQDADTIAAMVFMDLSQKALIADARLLRWCEWPDCLRSFHVITGPDPEIDGKGWIRTATHDLLCPDHANTGHRPQRPSWEHGSPTMTGFCECGAYGEQLRATLESSNDWWRGHVRTAVPA